MGETLDRIMAFKKAQLHRLLDQCTKEQEAKFDRMYGSRDTIPEDRVDWAIHQCERTVEMNKVNQAKAKDKEEGRRR